MDKKKIRYALERALRETRQDRKAEEVALEHLLTTFGEKVVALFPDKPGVIENLRDTEEGLEGALKLLDDSEEKSN